MRAKIARRLGGRDSRDDAGYQLQHYLPKNEGQSAHREPLFWKESPGRKRQNEFPALSIACLDSGKREGKGDWLDSLPTE
jgi:hypothetical protein